MNVYVGIPMTQANVPFNSGKPDLSDRGVIETETTRVRKIRRDSQEETSLTLILLAIFGLSVFLESKLLRGAGIDFMEFPLRRWRWAGRGSGLRRKSKDVA